MANALRWFVLCAVATLCLGPFLFLLSTSLEGDDVFRLETLADLLPNQFDTSAYREVFVKLPDLKYFFLNTAFLCFFGVLLELCFATLAAYPLARMNFAGKGWIMAALLATMMLPSQANIIVNFVTIRQIGLYDTLTAVLLPSAVSVFGIFLMRQAFLVVPKDLEDAARMDGAGEWYIFRHVMVPLTRPALGTLALFSFVAHWNSFMWPLVILQERSNYPLSVGLAYMANTFDSNFRLVAAGSVMAMIPILVLFLVLQKQFIKGITAGAVK
ncbi:MAG: carbohydrate ABC transporter permease [Vulcanimicrobiota bacterium]